MSTENQEPAQKTEEIPQERQYTEIELKAIDQGWIPKEEFDGDISEFIDAPEFVRRGELFDKIERQSKELKVLRAGHEALRQHHFKVKKMEYERAVKALKAERRQAMISGDTEHALALEEKMENMESDQRLLMEEARQAAIEESDDSYTPQFQSWVERNMWYETNDTMRAAADALGKKFHAQGNSPEKVLTMVEREIRKEFSHKFKPVPKTQTVEPSSRVATSSKDSFKLSAEEEQIMQKIVSVTPGFTKEAYIKELKALKSRVGE